MNKPKPTLKDIHAYPALAVEKRKHTEYEKHVSPNSVSTWVNPEQLFGLEFEIEGFKFGPPVLEYYWKAKEDNSLRNQGWEFTSIPLRAKQFDHAYDYLVSRILACNKEPQMSSRCSVHVHMNVRNYTIDQLINLIILYCIFEKHFFLHTKPNRESNLFCVPLYKTIKYGNLQQDIYQICQCWHKYWAFNLGTVFGADGLPSFGTVEYRHMHGTLDKQELVTWLNNLQCLHKAAENMDTETLIKRVKDLNTTSEYYALYGEIFGPYTLSRMHKVDFEEQISIFKLWLFSQKQTYSAKAVAFNKGKDMTQPQLHENKVKLKTAHYIVPTWVIDNAGVA